MICSEDYLDRLAYAMILGLKRCLLIHLFSNKCNEWHSGFLSDIEINLVELITNRKVLCSVESGEYFYKLL